MTQDLPLVKTFSGRDIALRDLRVFFVFSPNNSGTTVISQYLASQIDGYLPPYGNNEGQMVPEVKAMVPVVSRGPSPWPCNSRGSFSVAPYSPMSTVTDP